MRPSQPFDKMPLTIIRPLCLEHEADIIEYARHEGYQKQKKLCPYEHDSHRSDIARLYSQVEDIPRHDTVYGMPWVTDRHAPPL